MGYTLLKATGAGIVLHDYHARRFEATAEEACSWRRVAAGIAPGVWSVWSSGAGDLRLEPHGGTRLREGMPVQFAPSPVAALRDVFAKPRPPCVYDAVRRPALACLLTSTDGTEIFEACSAAVVSWDGAHLICVPDDRPRVWSTAEAAIREHLAPRQALIRTDDPWPILLVNAVKGCCAVAAEGRPAFPAAIRQDIEALFEALTGRVQPSIRAVPGTRVERVGGPGSGSLPDPQ